MDMFKVNDEVKVDGSLWLVLSVGAERNGKVYLHLASKTEFTQQKNGRYPKQICDWVSVDGR
jgi:hypothetical protein